ncbi:hypothetical protein ERO13_D01G119300v2 [Gossypium hirsutum]|uniref:Enhancer of polycomb-like protein n=1 Tax=Gossypium hirsutum TaxID=3635 RepID=A0A1U8KZ65_GOSHI|nr:uncharacterized protein LOC107922267 isoform X2 [Gossypium hirsutum]KAG4162516.1 hypothetical protein ERO13_D01G119300v2 [Gossypium hirsutum]
MPSVGMRRTTRVFRMVKSSEALVLRSGRRLWPDSVEVEPKSGVNKAISEVNGNPKILVNEEIPKKQSRKKKAEAVNDDATDDRRFGVVYSRKRKRNGVPNCQLSLNSEQKKCGKKFHRRRVIKKTNNDVKESRMFAFVVGNGGYHGWFSNLLWLVLGYLKRANVRFSGLAAFLMSQPLSSVYASNGVHLLRGLPANRSGICKFYGDRGFIPLFYVDFSAVPYSFMYMHYGMLLCSRRMQLVLVNTDEIFSACEEDKPCLTSVVDFSKRLSGSNVVKVDNFGSKGVSDRASKLKEIGRNGHYKHGLSRIIQRRRSSMRRRRARSPWLLGIHKGADSLQCSANILVTEPDRCYREEGAIVALELSASREWLLVVEKDGSTKYTYKVDRAIRPSSCNRFTHAIIWTGDDNWKLEFVNRQDWVIFKDLYKECSERNAPSSTAKMIPVPGVCEVSGYEDRAFVPFQRPDFYITLDGDEVSRALAKRTANYDMDSEDEEWLKNFNNAFFSGNGNCEHLSEDCFELMVDAFEKEAYFRTPDDHSDDKGATNLCLDLASGEVVEAVHAYWLRKRKRRSALLRVFQGHKVKKSPVVPKPVLRKRRLGKRQASSGRGKQPSLLQAMAAEHHPLGEENAMVKVEEARASAARSVELAILKRQQAQLLMQNADMATYKAVMALRIAEAARFIKSSDVSVAQLFDP